jgi:hypothetical protein
MDEIATEFVDSLKLARVELNRSPNLGLWYGVRCLPIALYFSEGEVRVGIFRPRTRKRFFLSCYQLSIRTHFRDCAMSGDEYVVSFRTSVETKQR